MIEQARRFLPPWRVEELNTEPPWWWRTEVLALMAAMTYEGRLELLAAAVVGAALGFVTWLRAWKAIVGHIDLGTHWRTRCRWVGLLLSGFAGQKLIGAGTGPPPMRSFQEAAE